MATKTIGTNATTSLVAVSFLPGGGILPADIATIAQNIKDDINPAHPVVPSAFGADGILYLPNNRGWIRALPGDFIAVDTTTGWPILISARAAASGPYTHT